MMSLIFIVAFVSFLLLPITLLTIFLSLQHSSSSSDGDHHYHVDSMYNHYGRSISNHLLNNTIFSNRTKVIPSKYKDLAGVKLYQRGKNIDGDGKSCKVECGVCLSAIEQGDEIRELRCNHLFHRECLDSWVSTGSATCPLCRGAVRAPPSMMVERTQGCGVAELLVFELFSTNGRRPRREDNWWIR